METARKVCIKESVEKAVWTFGTPVSAGRTTSTMPRVLGHLQCYRQSAQPWGYKQDKVHAPKELSICGSRETYGQTRQNAKS